MNQKSSDGIDIMRDESLAASLMKLGVPTMIGMLNAQTEDKNLVIAPFYIYI